jgi:hypothetical protein
MEFRSERQIAEAEKCRVIDYSAGEEEMSQIFSKDMSAQIPLIQMTK